MASVFRMDSLHFLGLVQPKAFLPLISRILLKAKVILSLSWLQSMVCRMASLCANYEEVLR